MEPLDEILECLRSRPDEPLLPRRPFDLGLVLLVEGLEGRVPGVGVDCLRAALHLWNDDLDRAHAIAQDANSSTGSLIHGIMHRREGDFSNACYWFRRAGAHAVYERLGAEMRTGGRDDPAFAGLRRGVGVDPAALVSAVEDDPQSVALRALQRRELELLVEYCREALE